MGTLRVPGTLPVAVFAITLFSNQVHAQLCRYFELQELFAPDPGRSDTFGNSIAADGDHLVVGAFQHDFATFNDGAVFVYRRMDPGTPNDPSDDGWGFVQECNALDGLGGNLGGSVSISGDRMVAGSHGSNDACGGVPGCSSGAAYVFRLDGNTWVTEQRLLASDLGVDLRFGESVSISGSWIAAGSVWKGESTPATGAAYLFRLDDNGTPSDPTDDFWVEHLKLTTPHGATDDRFGQFVALGDDRLIVGAPWLSNVSLEGATDPGSAYVYRHDDSGTPADRSDDQWVYEAKLTSSDGEPRDYFGGSLALSGDRAIIGATSDDGQKGSAYVFRRDDNGTPSDASDDFWYQEAKLIPSDRRTDGVGVSVAIRGDRAAVGAPSDSTILGVATGSAYVFRYVGGQWVQEQKLLASNAEFSADFGISVAIGDGQVFVGAKLTNTAEFHAGSAYKFSLVDDCNGNCIPDDQDIAGGFSADCDGNGIPDECEDCNGNGVGDNCDLAAGTSTDCNANAIPDECEADCNANGTPDDCDITAAFSLDCNANRVPDECELNNDCNGDGIPDDCAAVCSLDCECRDGSVCTFDRCIAGVCTNTPALYGDVDHDDDVDLFDLFCVLSGFSGDFGACSFQDVDLEPCAGNGTINLFDLFAVLNAFAGDDPCCGG